MSKIKNGFRWTVKRYDYLSSPFKVLLWSGVFIQIITWALGSWIMTGALMAIYGFAAGLYHYGKRMAEYKLFNFYYEHGEMSKTYLTTMHKLQTRYNDLNKAYVKAQMEKITMGGVNAALRAENQELRARLDAAQIK